MIVGLGIETVDVSRFEASLDRFGDRLRRRLFTARECAYAAARSRGAESLAVRFAAKRAARQALGKPGLPWRDLEIVREGRSAPTLCLHGAAAEAARGYDRVIVRALDKALPELEGPFDTICCYDVLEHVLDPWSALAELRLRLSNGGHLHVSVPNARHFSLARDLLIRGSFRYADSGHRDVTHLRWFTSDDLEAALRGAGFQVISRGHPPVRPAARLLEWLTRGLSSELLVYQISALAAPDPRATA